MNENIAIVAADDWNSHWANYDQVTAINPAQRWRFRSIKRTIQSFGLGHQLAITDLGCGQGDLLSYLHDQFPKSKLVGIEPSEIGCRLARQKTPSAKFLEIDITTCEDANNIIDSSNVIICTEVLEHLDHPELLMSSLAKKMNQDSTLLISVPGGPRSKFDKHIGHRRHFDRTVLEKLLKDSSFGEIDVYSSGFPGFNFYKICTILMGKRLISAPVVQDSSKIMKLIAGIFLFIMNRSSNHSRFGWQLFAVCKI
jgi:2-polyprenyl-3-methyl-5-hydroxy-6-metoxy-1,4-benzoquinol methylase